MVSVKISTQETLMERKENRKHPQRELVLIIAASLPHEHKSEAKK
jgi:Na+-transporting methylmalonyl-CoA/oxaloacetate decarboxylase gamma subunit